MWTQRTLLLKHKNSGQRYSLFKFFVGNGVDPTLAVQFIIISDYVNGKPVSGNYEPDALRELERMRVRALRNDPQFFGPMAYYDMHNKEMQR